jgi:type II secretory ATPase GspE/PulE/Tfp pilus assembly ATPase PilB-like protein
MIDDLTDDATARRVIEAAREHLIIVGVQALDVGRAVSRFIGMVQDRKGVSEVLRLVTSQRLARMLCRQCKEAYRPRPEFLRKANLTKQNVDVLYRVPLEREEKRGKVVVCPGCENAGFIDRTGFFEVMPIDAEAREMIAEGKTMADVRLHARKRGSRSLQEAGLRRVIEGLTSVDEVLRVIQKPS